MNRMLVVVFSEASKGFGGHEALKSLDRDGAVYGLRLRVDHQES